MPLSDVLGTVKGKASRKGEGGERQSAGAAMLFVIVYIRGDLAISEWNVRKRGVEYIGVIG